MNEDNKLGRPVPDWSAPAMPVGDAMTGRYARLERLDANRHADGLFRAFLGHDDLWDYLPYGPFASSSAYHRWIRQQGEAQDPLFMAIFDRNRSEALGLASYLRITPKAGTIELGHIAMSPGLQKTRVATEAIYLMMEWAFDAGYRRFEWKCNALNLASRRAAERFGLSYEGVFRQAAVIKGRNRDTAWYAAVDGEWPALREAFETWLRPENFDASGRQIERLSDLTRLVRQCDDPALAPR